MKKINRVLWGVVFIVFGVLLALWLLDILPFNIFFDGWWTLFLIVPATIGLFRSGNKTGNIICLGIGVLLLLACQDFIGFDLFWKLTVPLIIIAIGLNMIFGSLFSRKVEKAAKKINEKMKKNGENKKQYTAVFSGQDVKLEGDTFNGAVVTAVFGGVELDLRGALILEDCVIDVCAVFGGIDIMLPEGVNVKRSATAIFGGIDIEHENDKNGVTVYIQGLCMFGGVDIT